MIFNRSQVAVLACAGLLALSATPRAASAKPPSYATSGETITGTIASIQNVNHIFVADDRGFTDDVTLRSGAEVVSGGLHLEPGIRVTITGSAAGPTFLATRISTRGPGYGTPVTPESVYPAYAPTTVYNAAPSYYYQPYPSLSFRFGLGYGPFYRGYGFGYRPFYRGFGYGPYFRGYGFGYGPFYRGYGFGYGPYYRGYGFGYGAYYRGYGFGFRSFSGGFGSLRGHGWYGAYRHFR